MLKRKPPPLSVASRFVGGSAHRPLMGAKYVRVYFAGIVCCLTEDRSRWMDKRWTISCISVEFVGEVCVDPSQLVHAAVVACVASAA